MAARTFFDILVPSSIPSIVETVLSSIIHPQLPTELGTLCRSIVVFIDKSQLFSKPGTLRLSNEWSERGALRWSVKISER
jgi:hypothetical protein